MKRKLGVLWGAILLVLTMTACGSGGLANSAVREDMAVSKGSLAATDSYYDSADIEKEKPESSKEMQDQILTGEKLVYTCNLRLQTLKYDETVQAIKNNITAYNGIIERETESDNAYRWYYEDYIKTSGTRLLSLTIRIPSEKYYQFLEAMEGTGKIISRESYVENISRQYYETDAYIKALEIQQERLLEMMEKAYSIEDMITIESRLSEVQYQLNTAKNKLSSMDADVKYSTITIAVEEVLEYTPEQPPQKTNTFLDRLMNTLKETWEFFWEMLEEILFVMIRLIPVAIVTGAAVILVLFIIRCCKKHRVRKLLKAAEKAHQKYAKEHEDVSAK